jgi:hypothetical protein
MEQTICPLSDTEHKHICAQEATVLKMLRARYGEVHLKHNEGDLDLLQRLENDDALRVSQDEELESIGIVFGQILATCTPLCWVSVEWQQEKVIALHYPKTTVVVFPTTMIAKRISRGAPVEFKSLFQSIVAQVEQMKDNPEYKR